MPAEDFFHNILENMADGVMALDFQGRIIMFNAAAGDILGLDSEAVLNETFARVFMAGSEENDAFNQVLLDAVYEQGSGLSTTIDYTRADGSKLTLFMKSSYLRDLNGTQDSKAVILVFSDISELKKLQLRQEADARKLGQAYQDLEEKNQLLQKAVKRVQVIRVVSTVVIIGFFLGFGLYAFQGDVLLKKIQGVMPSESSGSEHRSDVYTLAQRPMSASVSLAGTLKPLEEIVVSAPFDAKIEERKFSFGQVVDKGKLLLLLDTSDLEIKLRKARSNYIKANQKFRQLLEWESGTEVTRARRSLAKSKDELEVNQRKLEEATLLFEKGIISAQEVESAKRQMENARVDVQAAREELASVRSKASQENLALAEMELENAEVELDRLERQMAGREIRAPVSGVVIQPVSRDDERVSLEKGAEITAGTNLLAVGDLSGVTVETAVDEIDVHKISLGQPVKASGAAFPDTLLEGRVSHISAQAASGSKGRGATFDVRVVFPDLDAQSLEQIRMGMSADLEVRVYEKQKALLAPLTCVRMVRGEPRVKLLGADGRIQERAVETGITTLSSVEILSGLEPGDKLFGWNSQGPSQARSGNRSMP